MEDAFDDREVALPAGALALLGQALRERAGGGAEQQVLRSVGRTTGANSAQGIRGRTETRLDELSTGAFWGRVSRYLSRRGWGRLRHSAPHPGIGIVEASDWADTSDGSAFSEGLFAGLLSSVAGTDVEVMRVPSPGPVTTFAFGAPSTLDALRLHLVDAGDLRAALEAL